MNEIEKKRIGKFISLILRHDPQKIGLKLDANGWANIDELIQESAKHRVKFTRKELDEIVTTNDKQRYSYNDDASKIRANQGHSINIDLELNPISPPPFLYHGTPEKFVTLIKEEGLKPMTRQYVHLSADKETATKVGTRRGKPYIFTILSGMMHEDGILFYQAANGVWLTDYVDPKYLSKENYHTHKSVTPK